MDPEIGNFLQQLRAVRRIPTSQLARKAGVARATLNRWQTGQRQPRLPELEAVLDAMAVSTAERNSALALLTSVERKKREPESPETHLLPQIGMAPHCGDLLRATRMRKGMTQTEVAEATGVSQATVARWERAEVWPEEARQQLLIRALEAHPDEAAVLAAGRLPLLAEQTQLCEEAIQERLNAFCRWPYPPDRIAGADLTLITLAADAWFLACRSQAALKLLADIYTAYADYLYLQRRFSECEPVAFRAQEIYAELSDETDPLWARAALRASTALAHKNSQRACDRAIRQLRSGFPTAATPIYQAWMLSEWAKMESRRGHGALALRLSDQAVALAATSADLSELRFRQQDRAWILLRAGRPHEALAVTPSPAVHPYSLLTLVEAHLMLGQPDEAQRLLLRADAWLDSQARFAAHEIPYYQGEIRILRAGL